MSKEEVDRTCSPSLRRAPRVHNEISAFAQRHMERTMHAEMLSQNEHTHTLSQAYIVYTRQHTEPEPHRTMAKPTHSLRKHGEGKGTEPWALQVFL